MTKQYIGQKEVDAIKGTNVLFKDGTQGEFAEAQLEYMVTEEPKDLTQERDIMLVNVVPDMISVLEKHDIRKGDLDIIVNTLVGTYNRTFMIAIGKKFGTYEEGVSHEYFQENIRISDIRKSLN